MKAYIEGYLVGYSGKKTFNPHKLDLEDWIQWQSGFYAGSAHRESHKPPVHSAADLQIQT